MTLDQLKEGEKALIVKVRGRGAFRHRITEMGFVKGQPVELIRFAPMKDPVEYRILNSDISLRRKEAALIEIVLTDEEEPMDSKLENPGNPARNKEDNCRISTTEHKVLAAHKIEVCMVGNPNAGKTSLFNALSGANEHVANYSGVTVDAKTVTFKYRDYTIELTDLPGTYSLSPYTPEERYVQAQLLEKKPDVIINVVDSSNLERNLYLTTQLIDMDFKMVMALNMFDELIHSGAKLDYDLLGTLWGLPCVPTVGSKGKGIKRLCDKIIDVYNEKETKTRHIHIPYEEPVERSISLLQSSILSDEKYVDVYSSRFLSLKILENDMGVLEQCRCISNMITLGAKGEEERKKIQHIYDDEAAHVITDSRYAFIKGALKECFLPGSKPEKTVKDKLDSVLTHKFWGYPIFLAFLWVMFQTTFAVGQYPMDWIQQGVDGLHALLMQWLPDNMFKDLLLDGILQGIGGVIIFLPNILILFSFISFMEASGYMARVTFIMDKLMHSLGLHGKSFIPLIIGFGCNVPAVMATRTIENRKDRLITMLIVPFMACSARLPIFILLTGAFFPKYAGTVIFLIYIFGVLISILSAILFRHTILKSNESPFVMEFPPYRWPTVKMFLHNLLSKTKSYLQKVGGIILIASMVIWALGYFPQTTESLSEQEHLSQSYLGQIGGVLEPVLRPLGFDGDMGICLLAGISAKEVVVSTMSVMGVLPRFTPLTALSFMAFALLYFPCIGVFSAVRKESGSWKWAVFMAVYTVGVAYLASLLIYQIGRLF